MAEMTGIALDIPGLVKACVDLYEQSLTWRNFEDDSSHLLTALTIEHVRLQAWRARYDHHSSTVSDYDPVVCKSIVMVLQQVQGVSSSFQYIYFFC